MKRILWAIVGFTLVMSFSSVASAQWSMGEGNTYGKVWARATVGKKGFDLEGETFDTESFTLLSARLYGEYGLTDRITLVGYAEPFGFASYGDDSENLSSKAFIGPVEVGSRYGILDGPLKLAAELRLGATSEMGEENLAPEGEAFVFVPAIGTANATGELQLGYGFSSFWVMARAGFTYFTNSDAIDPALTGRFQFGWNSSFGLGLALNTMYYQPTGEVDFTNVAGVGNTSYLGWGLGVSYWFIENLGVSASFEGVVFAKSNAATPAITLGFEARN